MVALIAVLSVLPSVGPKRGGLQGRVRARVHRAVLGLLRSIPGARLRLLPSSLLTGAGLSMVVACRPWCGVAGPTRLAGRQWLDRSLPAQPMMRARPDQPAGVPFTSLPSQHPGFITRRNTKGTVPQMGDNGQSGSDVIAVVG